VSNFEDKEIAIKEAYKMTKIKKFTFMQDLEISQLFDYLQAMGQGNLSVNKWE